MKKNAARKAYTFIEIVVVIALVSLAAGLAVVNILRSRMTAEQNMCVEQRRAIEHAELVYFIEKKGHSQNMADLVINGNLGVLPKCPARGTFAWVLFPLNNPGYQAYVGCSIHGSSVPMSIYQYESFTGGKTQSWTETGKYWAVTGGKYYGGKSGAKTGENRTFYGDTSWKDYSLQADVALISGGSASYGFGMYFRVSNYSKPNGYVFLYDPYTSGGVFQIKRVTNGSESKTLASVAAPAGYVWTGVEKQVRIDVSGSTFKVYISDVNGGSTAAVSATDTTYKTGSAGLKTWNNAYASFDNVQASNK